MQCKHKNYKFTKLNEMEKFLEKDRRRIKYIYIYIYPLKLMP